MSYCNAGLKCKPIAVMMMMIGALVLGLRETIATVILRRTASESVFKSAVVERISLKYDVILKERN